ncbi:tumor necrosis factor alpha-induced protein 8-like protein 1 [Ditylenchus destructor]|nr:tumor necrosis factor alpha-induced protein 8-like protein 1 [Ditylenchus destructor]
MSVHQNTVNKESDLCKDPNPLSPAPVTSTSANSIILRAQKKLLSRLSNRSVVKHIIDQRMMRFIDELQQILLFHYSLATVEKIIKCIIKVTVKIGLLAKENILADQHQQALKDVEAQFHSLSMTLISFQTIAYSYEYSFLAKSLQRLQSSLHSIVGELLSKKSVERLEFVFKHLTDKELLDIVFSAKNTSSLSDFASTLEGLLLSAEA